VPVFIYYSFKNEFVRDALHHGWTPIILAMLISSTGGYIMEGAISIYSSIAVFQPVINGVGGNLVAIFASRLSTALHRTSTQGKLASWAPKRWFYYPVDTFFGRSSKNKLYFLY
jgi:solute carrier family 41